MSRKTRHTKTVTPPAEVLAATVPSPGEDAVFMAPPVQGAQPSLGEVQVFKKIGYPGGPEAEVSHKQMFADMVEKLKASQQQNCERLVRKRAYFIWEEAGYPHGCDQDHWLQAEREFKDWLHQLTTAHFGRRNVGFARKSSPQGPSVEEQKDALRLQGASI